MVNYKLNVGRSSRVTAGAIVGALANEGGIKGSQIGSIDIRQHFTIVGLPEDLPRDFFDRLRDTKIAGEFINIPQGQRSQGRRRWSQLGGGRLRAVSAISIAARVVVVKAATAATVTATVTSAVTATSSVAAAISGASAMTVTSVVATLAAVITAVRVAVTLAVAISAAVITAAMAAIAVTATVAVTSAAAASATKIPAKPGFAVGEAY